MTLWSPRIQNTPDPIYVRIADAVERDVHAGVLVAGSQLPTHRRLALDLGITPVTVTRAYAEAARRGLVESATGRGTFVRTSRRDLTVASEIDLATNVVAIPLPTPTTATLVRAAATMSSGYGVGPGSERHRSAGAAWIGRRTDPSRVIVTAGTQHALFLALAATTKPGDVVLSENVTYHGAKAVAALLHLRLEPLPMDRFGILPDALERAARAKTSRVLYMIPTLQNPTGALMPEKRRRELAAIAEKHGLTIIEDDVCGFLLEDAPPPVASFAPDRTIFITGLGKAIAGPMRIGYVSAPESWIPRLQSSHAASILFASPILAELAATWIEDGTASRMAAARRSEIALRGRIARRILGKRASADPHASHLWLELPKRWTADSFAEEARRRRVRVASASSFAVSDDVPRAVRLCIGAPATVAELESALAVVAAIDEERSETVV
jgi:DNA-binding transcriptional MocR family regulator